MNVLQKKILEEQLVLLSERSKKVWGEELADLTNAMINLVQILEPDTQNQSFSAVSTRRPCVVQLPIEDLVALYAERAKV